MDRGAWRATVHGAAESDTTEATRHGTAHNTENRPLKGRLPTTAWGAQSIKEHWESVPCIYSIKSIRSCFWCSKVPKKYIYQNQETQKNLPSLIVFTKISENFVDVRSYLLHYSRQSFKLKWPQSMVIYSSLCNTSFTENETQELSYSISATGRDSTPNLNQSSASSISMLNLRKWKLILWETVHKVLRDFYQPELTAIIRARKYIKEWSLQN